MIFRKLHDKEIVENLNLKEERFKEDCDILKTYYEKCKLYKETIKDFDIREIAKSINQKSNNTEQV